MNRCGKLTLFYIIFYGVLSSLFILFLLMFYETLNDGVPKWQLEASIIGTNPGLGFRPLPTLDNIEGTLVWFQALNRSGYLEWVNNLKGFLKTYDKPNKVKMANCSYDQFPKAGEVCDVDHEAWSKCGHEKFFEYHRNTPCVFIKLNKIYGWKPDCYRTSSELPSDMPKQLKDHISNTSQAKRNTVWVSCEGETPADIEDLGPIAYYPEIQGFPGYYYPYRNYNGYMSPLVAIQFLNTTRGRAMNIECKAWAKNIKHDRKHLMGSVRFELLLD